MMSNKRISALIIDEEEKSKVAIRPYHIKTEPKEEFVTRFGEEAYWVVLFCKERELEQLYNGGASFLLL